MSSFIKSAASVPEYFRDRRPQVCLIGRSNVGKSTLVNALANDRKLAKTSSTPGHTKLVNFFDFGRFVLVDLPGYGYQTGSDRLDEILIEYLNYGHNLQCAIQLCNIDVVTTADQEMAHFLAKMPVKHLVVLTKSDRVSRGQLAGRIQKIATYLGVLPEQVVATSAQNRTNIAHLLDIINAICRQPKDYHGQEI